MKHLYIILFVLPLIGFGQGWEQTFLETSEEWGGSYSVQQTNDGGYIISGFKYESFETPPNVYLIKTDQNGEEQWSQTFGGDGHGYSVQQTTDGGYIILGEISTDDVVFNNLETYYHKGVYLIKTDENGNEQWSQIFGGTETDRGYSVQQTTDGGYIITGVTNQIFYFYTFPSYRFGDTYLIKTDENGNEQWSQTFGGEWNDEGHSVQQTLDGGYIITGSSVINKVFNNETFEYDYYVDVYLIKTDENGNEQWSQTFGGDETETSWSVQQTLDGGYIITGDTESFGNGNSDVYLIKTDENGEEQWSQTFGGTEDDRGRSVQQTFDGGYVLCGWNSSDVYLLKTDENGNEEWSQTFDIGYGSSVQQTLDGGYILTGMKINSLLNYIFLIKTDSEGNVTTTSTIEIPIPTSKRELVKTTNILGQENTTTKNQPLIEIYDDGSTEKKIVIE